MPPQPPDIESIADELSQAHPALPVTELRLYLSEVTRWNDRAGLVSRRDPVPTLRRLVTQSVGMWELILREGPEPSRAVDIGTGGGFPGLIWKLVSPRLRLLLVERKARKVTFLNRVQTVMGLEGMEIFEGDARLAAAVERHRGAFAAGATLAVAPPEEAGLLVEPFLSDGGVFATLVAAASPPPERAGRLRLLRARPDADGTLCLYR